MRKLKIKKTTFAIIALMLFAIPFVFYPNLLTEELELFFQFIVVSTLIIYIFLTAKNYF